MEEVISPEKTKSQKSARKERGVSTTLGWLPQLFYTAVITRNRSNQPDGSSENTLTPKISVLFKDSDNIKVGYFGKLEFLENQAAFDEVFVKNPAILYPNITTSRYSISTARRLN